MFRTRYRLVDRCPGCGYRFEREPGFFLGAWFLNFMLVELVHFVLVMAFIVWKATHPDAGLLAPLALGVGLGIALPIICYPWSQTVWAAMDLGMTPLELQEIVDAADSLAGGHDDGPVGADDPSAAPEERDGRPDQ